MHHATGRPFQTEARELLNAHGGVRAIALSHQLRDVEVSRRDAWRYWQSVETEIHRLLAA